MLRNCAVDKTRTYTSGVGNSFSIEVELRNTASCLALKSRTLTGQTQQGAAQSGEGVVPTTFDWDELGSSQLGLCKRSNDRNGTPTNWT